MVRFFHNQSSGNGTGDASLGPLEREVMEVLWAAGNGCVRDVAQKLARPLAYTTVMTTMDRLFKKGLLRRKKFERAFLYAPRLTRAEWESQRAGDVLAGFLAGPGGSHELLLSSLVEAVGQHDPMLLEELEQKIRRKREELQKAEGGKR
jgi:predicted transcriptional regulator